MPERDDKLTGVGSIAGNFSPLPLHWHYAILFPRWSVLTSTRSNARASSNKQISFCISSLLRLRPIAAPAVQAVCTITFLKAIIGGQIQKIQTDPTSAGTGCPIPTTSSHTAVL